MVYFGITNHAVAKAGGLEFESCTCGRGTSRVEPVRLEAQRDCGYNWPDLLPLISSWPFVISGELLEKVRDAGMKLDQVTPCVRNGDIPKRYWSIRPASTVSIELLVDQKWIIPELCECGRVMGEHQDFVPELSKFRYDFSTWNGECVFCVPRIGFPFGMMCTSEFVKFLHDVRPQKKLLLLPFIDGMATQIDVPYMQRKKNWVPDELREYF